MKHDDGHVNESENGYDLVFDGSFSPSAIPDFSHLSPVLSCNSEWYCINWADYTFCMNRYHRLDIRLYFCSVESI